MTKFGDPARKNYCVEMPWAILWSLFIKATMAVIFIVTTTILKPSIPFPKEMLK
ncbi:hypothetical protein M405DRAFT_828802 [Rhizopogon salebrosus TDB-379]|nr:hypothetical protein M405DRAFT_828802 [Rhizopogon salebrosus TDB-379]